LSSVAKNSFWLFFSYLFYQFFVFLQLKILTNWISASNLGEYFTILALSSILSIFCQLGLPFVLVRFVAKYRAWQEKERTQNLIYFSWGISFCMGIIIFMVLLVKGENLLNLLYAHPPSLKLLVWGFLLNLVLSLKALSFSVFWGWQRMEVTAWADGATAFLVALGLFLFRMNLDIILIIKINLLVNLFFTLIISFYLLKCLNQIPSSQNQGLPLFSDIKSFWSMALLTGFLSIGLNYADQILISLLLPFSAVSFFYLAVRVIYFSRHLLSIPLQALSPEITQKWELEEKGKVVEKLNNFNQLLFISGVFLASLSIGLSRPIILFISFSEFIPSIPLLIILSLALPGIAIFSPLTYFFRAIGQIKFSFFSDLIWLLGYLSLGYILIKFFGLVGMVWAQVLITILLAILNWVIVKRKIKVGLKIEKLYLVLISGILTALPLFFLEKFLVLPNFLELILGGLMGYLIFDFALIKMKIISYQAKEIIGESIKNLLAKKLILNLIFWPEKIF
jgi:O-antigen/teichoic acid export membrane protein